MPIHTRKKIKEMKEKGSMMDAFILEKLYKEIESIATTKFNQMWFKFKQQTTGVYNNLSKLMSDEKDSYLKDIKNTAKLEKDSISTEGKNVLNTISSTRETAINKVNETKDKAVLDIEIQAKDLVVNAKKYKGDPGEKGKDGKNGSPDTANQVVAKINKATTEIKAIATLKEEIKQLKQTLKNIRQQTKGGGKSSGGGIGDVQHESKSVDAGSTSVETVYPIAGAGNAIFKVSYRNMIWHKDVEFTVGADRKTLTLSNDAQGVLINNSTIEVTYIRG